MNSNMVKKRANNMPIRNFLPTMCFNVRKSARTNDLMRVEILFNDLHRTPQSSLVNSTAYELRVYVLTRRRQQPRGTETTTTSVRLPKKDRSKVNATLLGSLIVASSSLQVVMDNLYQGVYLLEVIVINFCADINLTAFGYYLQYYFIFPRKSLKGFNSINRSNKLK